MYEPETERRYPIVDGVPILIAEERSLFDIEDVPGPERDAPRPGPVARSRARGVVERALRSFLALPPTRSRNVAAKENFHRLSALLATRSRERTAPARVLVLGGRIIGAGMDALLDDPGLQLVETDVVIGPRTQLVCDAHDLPFADGTFDAVVIQAVLEAVPDPERVASEIHRVLVDDGVVYSEAPFIQQVHEGAFDFNRFTHLGHRRLWRSFEEIESGAQCGPGMALLWSIEGFLQAFVGRRRLMRGLISRVVTLTGFWLKYFDELLARGPGGIDAASGTFFLGRRRKTPLSDRAILRSFRGVLPRNQRLPRVATEPEAGGEEGQTGGPNRDDEAVVSRASERIES
jgi:SAM-dependent methyltransferase